MKNKTIFYLAIMATVLAFIVITVGAYTRLSHAGLGCPDWPGCYGRLIVPASDIHVETANKAYPDRPLEIDKAWIEMAHRYIAGTLGILILLICMIAWLKRHDMTTRIISSGLLLLVTFQALLGMWTVTLLLKPFIVTLHLIGGMSILSLLYWLSLHQKNNGYIKLSPRFENYLPFTVLAFIVLCLQISLGGWTSTNYAALACSDFPTCHGEYLPKMDLGEAFVLWRGLGINYEGGVLDGPARTAIHVTHRIGAIVTFIIILMLGIKALLQNNRQVRITAVLMLMALLLQVSLGIANVVMHLPLFIAVAHNGVAALLLLTLITMLHLSILNRSK